MNGDFKTEIELQNGVAHQRKVLKRDMEWKKMCPIDPQKYVKSDYKFPKFKVVCINKIGNTFFGVSVPTSGLQYTYKYLRKCKKSCWTFCLPSNFFDQFDVKSLSYGRKQIFNAYNVLFLH